MTMRTGHNVSANLLISPHVSPRQSEREDYADLENVRMLARSSTRVRVCSLNLLQHNTISLSKAYDVKLLSTRWHRYGHLIQAVA
jgi:hypothetical protein